MKNPIYMHNELSVVPLSFHLGQPSHEHTQEPTRATVEDCRISRELDWPIPENVIVLPCSDERWVAFKVGVGKETIA
ncbi:hypothetical protein ACS0TY_027027 [Phlomoides rotata]